MIRLAKFVAECTELSTRQSLYKLANGCITVDGIPQFENILIDPRCTVVQCDYKTLSETTKKFYVLHKPINVLCAKHNAHDTRKTVYDYCHDTTVFTVGRLDYATSGLIILTNDGSVSQTILAPSSNITKEYHITAANESIDAIDQRLATVLSNTTHQYHILGWNRLHDSCISISIAEGKNREVRYLVAKCGVTDYALHRFKIGNLTLGALQPGEIKRVTRSYIIDNLY